MNELAESVTAEPGKYCAELKMDDALRYKTHALCMIWYSKFSRRPATDATVPVASALNELVY